MRRLWKGLRPQRQVVVGDPAIIDRGLIGAIVRRTSIAGLLGLVYGSCAGVIWAAYYEFGSESLRDRTLLVTADRSPLKLLPGARAQDAAASSAASAGPGPPAEEVAATAQGAEPMGEIRPAMAPRSHAERAQMAPRDTEGADASDGSGPDRVVDRLTPQGQTLAITAGQNELESAALSDGAPETPQESIAAGVGPPTPVFKPLNAIPEFVAEVAPAALDAPAASTHAMLLLWPPVPALKPEVGPTVRRQLAGAPSEPAAPPPPRTLPEGLRAFWANLKVMLASAPASLEVHRGSDQDSGNRHVVARAASSRNASGGADSSSAQSDGGGGNARDDNSGGVSTASSGGGTSDSNNGSSAGGGVSSSSSGSGSGVSSGGSSGRGGSSSATSRGRDDSSASRGDRGRGRGDSAREGRGGRGDVGRGGRGGRGDSARGDRGDRDGGRGGRGRGGRD